MRPPKKKPFSNSRTRSKFKIINWPEYNNILRNRGRIDFMISNNLGENWYEQNNSGKKRGGQRRYTDQAILVCLCCMNRRFDVFPLSPKYWFKRYA